MHPQADGLLLRHKSSSAAFLNALFIIYFLLRIFYISFEFVVLESSFLYAYL